MASRTYIIHTVDDPSEQESEGSISYVMSVKENSVTVFTRQKRINRKTGALFYSTVHQLSFTVQPYSPDPYPVLRVYEKGPAGFIRNISSETLLWGLNDTFRYLFGDEVGVKIEEELKAISGEVEFETNHNFFPLSSWVFPLVRNQKDFKLSTQNEVTTRNAIRRTQYFNKRLYKALNATTINDALQKVFKSSWIQDQQDFDRVKDFSSLWALGHWDLGMSVSEFETRLPEWETLVALPDFTFQMIDLAVKQLSKQERFSFLEKVCDLWAAVYPKRYMNRVEVDLKELTYSERKSLGQMVVDFVNTSPPDDGNLKHRFQRWYSTVVLSRLAEEKGSCGFQEVSNLLKEGFGLEARSFKNPGSGDLVWVPSASEGQLERTVYYSCLRWSVLPLYDVSFVVGEECYSASEGALVRADVLVKVVKDLIEEADDALLKVEAELTAVNRKLFWEVSSRFRNHKVTWKLVSWGVTDPQRLDWLREHKISSKEEVELLNSLPDMMFYDIISQDDE